MKKGGRQEVTGQDRSMSPVEFLVMIENFYCCNLQVVFLSIAHRPNSGHLRHYARTCIKLNPRIWPGRLTNAGLMNSLIAHCPAADGVWSVGGHACRYIGSID